MIELLGVGRDYTVGDSIVHALRDIRLFVAAGEYVSLMGPSGCGKSTLLHILGLLDRPTSGEFRLDGQSVERLGETELARLRRERIGFVFQSFHLVPRLSAEQNVALPLLFAGVPAASRRTRALSALERVGLAQRARHRPNQLSGGERQRVAIARALIHQPALLLADEPTGNLDSASGQTILTLLEGLNAQALTLVVVSHDPSLASRARRRLRMLDGAIVGDEGIS